MYEYIESREEGDTHVLFFLIDILFTSCALPLTMIGISLSMMMLSYFLPVRMLVVTSSTATRPLCASAISTRGICRRMALERNMRFDISAYERGAAKGEQRV